jgi:hypothetical protein
MPALSSWQLIVATMQRTASEFQHDAQSIMERLAEDGSSHVVNASRSAQMRMVMVAVGGFSMLEGILEQTRGWSLPFQEVDRQLRAKGLISIADDFTIYRLAINVLKHGYGDSYERLLRRTDVPFRVKSRDENFFDEGDVSEIPGLILVDENFVQSCSLVIQDAMIALRIGRSDI